MIVGCPTEVKTREYRVGMIPAGVRTLVLHGHQVIVQSARASAPVFPTSNTARPAPSWPPAPTKFGNAPT